MASLGFHAFSFIPQCPHPCHGLQGQTAIWEKAIEVQMGGWWGNTGSRGLRESFNVTATNPAVELAELPVWLRPGEDSASFVEIMLTATQQISPL